jgi:hypothetical protein
MLAPRSFTLWQSSQSINSRKQRHDRPKSQRRNESPTKQDSKGDKSPTITDTSRPTTPSSPVIIPMRSTREPAQNPRHDTRKERPHHGRKLSHRSERRARNVHDPNSIPPSVAALLAVTSIPPQRSNNSVRKRSGAGHRLTVDAILQHTDVAEKEFSLSLGKGSLDFLLSPPDELDEDDALGSETGQESFLSTRTMSSESIPSLDGESLSESPSMSSLVTPNSRGKRSLPLRRLVSVSSPPSESGSEDHPLSVPEIDVDELDFRVFQKPQQHEEEKPENSIEAPRRKSAFKSNLTSSLKALKSAARSLSSLTTPMITPDDFLTRSIISIDPKVPFTDERMPPLLEDTPTPALRRYLNPTTNAPIEAHVPSSLSQTMPATKCTASIQMQTYRISRAARSTSPAVISRRTRTASEDVFADVAGPVARQRDLRENSDFIRIAVMEMAMRKKGKLDDQKPGRARWALPARKPSAKSYEIGADGVPVRWIATTH